MAAELFSLDPGVDRTPLGCHGDGLVRLGAERKMDVYFSADVETDGPIPGPFSMLSFALVPAGFYDGHSFSRPTGKDGGFYCELRPISERFEEEALAVNQIDRRRLINEGVDPRIAMEKAASWISRVAGDARPVLVAYPLSFDWMWLYWYFIQYAKSGSPFNHSSCYDLKTAFAVKAGIPIAEAGRSKVPASLKSKSLHTHHAFDDAVEQAEIFANIFEWEGHRSWDR